MFMSRRRVLTVVILVGLGLVALEATFVIGAAAIRGELGFSWVAFLSSVPAPMIVFGILMIVRHRRRKYEKPA